MGSTNGHSDEEKSNYEVSEPKVESQSTSRHSSMVDEPLKLPYPAEPVSSQESTCSPTAAKGANKEVSELQHAEVDEVQSRATTWYRRLYARFRARYCPRFAPALVLPTPPTDQEKLLYLHTNRLPLYIVGVFAFLSLSAGMWLFTVSSVYFYWFSIFTFFLQLYLFISYIVGVVGKDFDYTGHTRIVEEHTISKESAPSIDIFLPVCMEPLEVLANTWKYVSQMSYPGELNVWVLDDGNQELVKQLADDYGFNYIVRDDRPRLKKAGNLRWAFARTSGDYFVIFDADFCPRWDFLLEILPEHIADPKTALVQTPQYFRVTKEQTWVEKGAGATQELFYRVVQVNRNKWGASICVGSNAVYRREAFVEVGGTAEIGFSEDVHSGFGAVDRGWKVKYLPICLACGACPDNPRAFFSQQMRWCMGSTTLLTNPHFWKSSMTLMQKLCYVCGFLYYSATALSIFISPIPGILLLWLRPDLFRYYNLAFAIPSILYGAVLFPLWARGSYGFDVQHVMIIQNYAYLNALKDKLCGTALQWVPSGDAKAHKSNKYRNMRILAWCWWFAVLGGMVTAVVWRTIHGFHFYNSIPLILLNAYNLYVVHPFLVWTG